MRSVIRTPPRHHCHLTLNRLLSKWVGFLRPSVSGSNDCSEASLPRYRDRLQRMTATVSPPDESTSTDTNATDTEDSKNPDELSDAEEEAYGCPHCEETYSNDTVFGISSSL
mgnify:FL=1